MIKKISLVISILLTFMLFAHAEFYPYEKYNLQYTKGYSNVLITDSYKQISKQFVGNWKKSGKQFVTLQKTTFRKIYLWIIILIPLIFLIHYIVIGPKRFSHDGEKYYIFNIINRIIHWIAAISFSLLVLSGLAIIFGKYLGGGNFVRNMRYIHAPAALIFTPTALIMFLMWIKDMFPMPGDIIWFLKGGGYLTKKKVSMPVGKFNPGQKMWFWLGTVGGFIMGYTGYYLFGFNANIDTLRNYVIIHNFLGMALLALFIVHLYMSLFAIKGSLKSMLTGYKYEEELEIMHQKYLEKVKKG